MRERGRILLSLSLWCVGFPLPILLSSLPNVHNAIRSIGPKLGHPALQKTEGSDARFSWWETTEGHYTRLRKTSSRISTLNNSRVRLRDCLEASCTAVRRVEQRKLSKHKKAPPPKTIAALFDVIGWCWPQRDRKSTRLNSSHGYISYAVFCLKKKTQIGCHLRHQTSSCQRSTHSRHVRTRHTRLT